MRPALVLPFHDPPGRLFELITLITPALIHSFTRAFLSVSPVTEQLCAKQLAQLRADPYFVLNTDTPDSLPGDHYRSAFVSALQHTIRTRCSWSAMSTSLPPSCTVATVSAF